MELLKCAIFSCQGLGDGLISLTLSNNLAIEGYQTTTYHPFLIQMQEWFPHLRIKGFSEFGDVEKELGGFDRFFIFFEKSPRMSQVIHYCKTHFAEKTTIINPIATPKTDYPYWENAKFDGRQTFADNLEKFARNILGCKAPTKENGITPLPQYLKAKYPLRVIIHPTSSRAGKNWPQEKFLALCKDLEARGYSPSLILTKEERKQWPAATPFAPDFANLSELAGFVYESGYMIGNDSGVGHLASSLGLPTVIICRSPMSSAFWRPSWSEGRVVCPPSWIPNIKGLRLRDKHWKTWVLKSSVFRAFRSLV